jgi:hypothetical protein
VKFEGLASAALRAMLWPFVRKQTATTAPGSSTPFRICRRVLIAGSVMLNSRARFPRVRKLIDRYTDLEWLKAHPSRKSIAALRQANKGGAVTGHQPHPDILAMSRSKLTPADIGH